MNPSQLKEYLKIAIQNRFATLITGSPGVGKTDVVTQTFLELEVPLVTIHPVVSNPSDLEGYLMIVKGTPQFVPFGAMKEVIESKTPMGFFLDDFGQAPPAVQAACMRPILAHRTNSHVIPDHVTFIAATNRRQDKAGVMGLLEPVKSRFITIVQLDVNVEDWIDWAIQNHMPSELIAFIWKVRPDLLLDFKPTNDLTNSPCPRTIAHVGKLFNTMPRELWLETFSGAAGEGFASEFMAYLSLAEKMPDPDEVIAHPTTSDIPSDISILYALCITLSVRATRKNFKAIMTFGQRCSPEFTQLILETAKRHDPKLTSTPEYTQWCIKDGNIMLN